MTDLMKAKGVSLIELMVALAIGTILVLGLVQVFSASRAAYQMSEGMARVQENSRFAVDFLQRDLRMVGHFGCSTDQLHAADAGITTGSGLDVHFSPVPYGANFGMSVQGYEAPGTAPGDTVVLGAAAVPWDPALPDEISSLAPLAGSDIVVIRYLYGEGIPVDDLVAIGGAGGQVEIHVDPDRWDALTSGGSGSPEMFGLSDCKFVDVFEADNQDASSGVVTAAGVIGQRHMAESAPAVPSTSPAGRYTGTQLRLFRAESIVYYVGTGTGGGPALFKARSNGGAYDPSELIEGVENLQLLYGLDNSPGGPTGYITHQHTAATLGNSPDEWAKVGLIQVGLLGRSPNAAVSTSAVDATRYPNALGVTFDATELGDTNYRSSYETTVALRNRLFGN